MSTVIPLNLITGILKVIRKDYIGSDLEKVKMICKNWLKYKIDYYKVIIEFGTVVILNIWK